MNLVQCLLALFVVSCGILFGIVYADRRTYGPKFHDGDADA
jgi:hypothetical protein